MRCAVHNLDPWPARSIDIGKARFFADFRDDVIQRFVGEAHDTTYIKGHVLFLQDDPAEFFYFVKSGWVKLFRETLDGNEVVIDVLPAGQVFGDSALFKNGCYPFAAEIIESATLAAIPLNSLQEELTRDPSLAMALLKHQADQNSEKDMEIEHRMLQNAPRRIGCFLLRLIKDTSREPVTLNLPYDKTLIAARLGMQPETFSRALTKIQEDTSIRVKGPTVEIPSIEELTQYTCSACTGTYPCQNGSCHQA